MEQVTVNIMAELAKLAPIVAVLIYFIWYFQSQLKNKDDEIKDLNTELRQNQKDTLTAINRMTDVVSDLKDLIKSKIV